MSSYQVITYAPSLVNKTLLFDCFSSMKDRKQPDQENMWIQDEPQNLYEPMADTNTEPVTQTEMSNYADLQRTAQENTYDQLNTASQYLQMGRQSSQSSTAGQDSLYVNQL